VIFGASGDLALRMLLPSLYFLEVDGLLPAGLRIVGTARGELDDAGFRARVEAAVRARAGEVFDPPAWARLADRLGWSGGDLNASDTYARLAERLAGADDRIFYLSTSPDLYQPITAGLAGVGLAAPPARVVVEKPLGRDLASCRAINDTLGAAFDEARIFRVDHYLGKEAVQNLLALRFANALFEPLWNKVSVDHVQITVAETIGVEGRGAYYDAYGAMRDMVQNHLLQLLCLVAMEPPASLDADAVRSEKVKVLRALRPIEGRDVELKTVRGQYGRGVAEGAAVPGYCDRDEGGCADTETFVAVRADIDNWRWAGVPFYLRTGKRLPERRSQIVVRFREVPHSIFPHATLLPNRLTIGLQPDEEIALVVMNKTPTLGREGGMELRPLALNLSLEDAFRDRPRRRIAYERLLLEALKGDATLFVRRDEAEAAWAWVDRIEDGWTGQGLKPTPYAAGTWGPAGAFALTERNGHSWYE
jgi:glucose-6-phosphate 1-dehydrogenase